MIIIHGLETCEVIVVAKASEDCQRGTKNTYLSLVVVSRYMSQPRMQSNPLLCLGHDLCVRELPYELYLGCISLEFMR